MKQLFITIMMAALLVTACGHRTSNGSDADSLSTDSVITDAAQPFAVDSIGLSREDSAVSVSVSIEWPKGGSEALTASIRRYICEELAEGMTIEGWPDVVIYKDGKTAVDSTLAQQYRSLASGFDESKANGIPSDGMQYLYSIRIAKGTDTETYVTYHTLSESYLGGAHGSASSTGMTFRKSDGLRIGYHTEFNRDTEQFEMKDQTLFSQPKSAKLAALIKEGVRSYFQEFQDSTVTDSQLSDELINVGDVNRIPLPSAPPIFTPKGLFFIYQQYEIAAYAAGMVNFTVDYDKVRPYLTKEAAALIK